MHTFSRLALILALFGPAVTAAQEAEQPEKYLLLATNRTGTMQGELNEDPLEYELVAMTVRHLAAAKPPPWQPTGPGRCREN